MLALKSIEEAFAIMQQNFFPLAKPIEHLPLQEARQRFLATDIHAQEYVPSFKRSSVDGYAVIASDTFGASDSIPAMLPVTEHILMGIETEFTLQKGTCAAIPTGGAIPEGADAVQMIEYTEDYGDGTIGILKAVAPGQHCIHKGDDVYPNKLVLKAGAQIKAKDIGALAALGITHLPVKANLRIGILTTGDEIVPVDQKPNNAQVRNVNTDLLAATVRSLGAEPVCYGIIKDQEEVLHAALAKAVTECDMVLISGGSSVGIKDATRRVLESQGKLLFHGLALKPGKPTMLAKIQDKPVFGLPGHPVAVFFVALSIVSKLIYQLMDQEPPLLAQVPAILNESVEANHGRTQFVAVELFTKSPDTALVAKPIRNKSGLITTLSQADGYFIIPQDCEGYAKNTPITVYTF